MMLYKCPDKADYMVGEWTTTIKKSQGLVALPLLQHGQITMQATFMAPAPALRDLPTQRHVH